MAPQVTNSVVFHFIGGGALFSGVGLVAAAAVASVAWRTRVVRVGVRLTAAVGMVFVALSATPFPMWIYYAWGATVLAWLGVQEMAGTVRTATMLRLLTVAACAGVALAELSYQLSPTIPTRGAETIYVVGDSISTGLGTGEKTWPQVLGEIQDREVVNLAKPGATTRTAWVQADRVPAGRSVVLVEIGGNDLLKARPAGRFELELRGLLMRLTRADRTVAHRPLR